MKLFELNDNEISLLKDIIEEFIFKGNKKLLKEYDKQTDNILDKLNKPITINREQIRKE